MVVAAVKSVIDVTRLAGPDFLAVLEDLEEEHSGSIAWGLDKI